MNNQVDRLAWLLDEPTSEMLGLASTQNKLIQELCVNEERRRTLVARIRQADIPGWGIEEKSLLRFERTPCGWTAMFTRWVETGSVYEADAMYYPAGD